jgi:hypothetical protein
LSAGVNVLNTTAVPSGEVHIITHIGLYYSGTVPGSIEAYGMGTLSAATLFQKKSPTSTVWYNEAIWIPLAHNDYMRMGIYDATAGDTARFRIAGYKMGAP